MICHVTANTYHGGRRLGEHTPDGHVLSTSATRTNEGSKCSRTDNEMIWQAVLENVQSDSLRKMMAKEGLVISVSLCTGNSSAGQVVWRPSQSHRAGHCVFRPPVTLNLLSLNFYLSLWALNFSLSADHFT